MLPVKFLQALTKAALPAADHALRNTVATIIETVETVLETVVETVVKYIETVHCLFWRVYKTILILGRYSFYVFHNGFYKPQEQYDASNT